MDNFRILHYSFHVIPGSDFLMSTLAHIFDLLDIHNFFFIRCYFFLFFHWAYLEPVDFFFIFIE